MKMSNVEGKSFHSKVLLFGEFTVIKNSMALAIPFHLFSGRLLFSEKETDFLAVREQKGQSELKNFGRYMQNLLQQYEQMKGSLGFQFDLSSFLFDVEQGLYFASTIPQGVGLGSSGALCAALFNRYGSFDAASERMGDISLLDLRRIFIHLESFFHGSSSGIDPLISYLNRPLLMTTSTQLMTVELPKAMRGEGIIFLLDTGGPRKTGPLVNLFLEKCKNHQFSQIIANELIPATHGCIESFLEGNLQLLFEHFHSLSSLQFEHFRPMIPTYLQDIWRKGLEEDVYKLKLCGAGGGGFMLGVCRNFDDAQKKLSGFQLRKLIEL